LRGSSVGALESCAGHRSETPLGSALAGAACWVVIYYLLPKPMLVYVFGHELTHAVWTGCSAGGEKFKHPPKVDM